MHEKIVLLEVEQERQKDIINKVKLKWKKVY